MLIVAVPAAGAPAIPDTCAWAVVPSPNPQPVVFLYDVGAISASDVWTVGTSSAGDEFSPEETLTQHWDGSSWLTVPSPDRPNRSNSLTGLSAVSGTDVWAVGATYPTLQPDPSPSARTLIERWDGSQWAIQPSPNVGKGDNRLDDVVGLSPSDVWAVGHRISRRGFSKSLVEHFDGRSWQVVASQNVPRRNRALLGITALSHNDLWAVGVRSRPGRPPRPLTMHYDGRSWQVVPAPAPQGSLHSTLADVVGVSGSDVWAVGHIFVPNASQTLIEHYDGDNWEIVVSPNPGGSGINSFNGLSGVDATAANDAWAVGHYFSLSDQPAGSSTLAIHWDGSAWTMVATPREGTGSSLSEVDALSLTDVWAVGWQYPEERDSFAPPSDGLILHYAC